MKLERQIFDHSYIAFPFIVFFIRDDNSPVALKFFDGDRRIHETVYGRQYTVKAEITHPNGTQGIRVKNCFAFNKDTKKTELIDDRGLVTIVVDGSTVTGIDFHLLFAIIVFFLSCAGVLSWIVESLS